MCHCKCNCDWKSHCDELAKPLLLGALCSLHRANPDRNTLLGYGIASFTNKNEPATKAMSLWGLISMQKMSLGGSYGVDLYSKLDIVDK